MSRAFENFSKFITDDPGRGVETQQDLQINRISNAADKAIEKKYPQLSSSLRYPLRQQQIKILLELQKKLLRSKEKQILDEDGKYEKEKMDEYYKESTKYGREQMKHYTLLNRNVDHSIPQIVKNALFSLNLYKEIPIVNGVLMAPYANDLSEYKGKTQKIWKNGKLNRLNQFKLQSLIYKNEKMRRLMDEKKLNQLPEYSILRTYITNPSKLGSVVSKISKKQSQFKNPKKMASLLFKEVKEQLSTLDKDSSLRYKSSLLSHRDHENMEFLSRINPKDMTLVKSNKNKVRSYIDDLLSQERLTGDSRIKAYSHYAPAYLSILKKE